MSASKKTVVGGVPLDLVSLLNQGDPVQKKSQVDFQIIGDSPRTLDVRILAPRLKKKEKKSQESFEETLLDSFRFDEIYWSQDEWEQMLGIKPASHWVDRILLLCRAQIKAQNKKPKERGARLPFVALPDGEIFSTRILWPPSKAQNPLTRVPDMVVWLAFRELRLKQEGVGVKVTPEKIAKLLEQWFLDHGAKDWWLLRMEPGTLITPEPLLVTKENVETFRKTLKRNKLNRFDPLSKVKSKKQIS